MTDLQLAGSEGWNGGKCTDFKSERNILFKDNLYKFDSAPLWILKLFKTFINIMKEVQSGWQGMIQPKRVWCLFDSASQSVRQKRSY